MPNDNTAVLYVKFAIVFYKTTRKVWPAASNPDWVRLRMEKSGCGLNTGSSEHALVLWHEEGKYTVRLCFFVKAWNMRCNIQRNQTFPEDLERGVLNSGLKYKQVRKRLPRVIIVTNYVTLHLSACSHCFLINFESSWPLPAGHAFSN